MGWKSPSCQKKFFASVSHHSNNEILAGYPSVSYVWQLVFCKPQSARYVSYTVQYVPYGLLFALLLRYARPATGPSTAATGPSTASIASICLLLLLCTLGSHASQSKAIKKKRGQAVFLRFFFVANSSATVTSIIYYYLLSIISFPLPKKRMMQIWHSVHSSSLKPQSTPQISSRNVFFTFFDGEFFFYGETHNDRFIGNSVSSFFSSSCIACCVK